MCPDRSDPYHYLVGYTLALPSSSTLPKVVPHWNWLVLVVGDVVLVLADEEAAEQEWKWGGSNISSLMYLVLFLSLSTRVTFPELVRGWLKLLASLSLYIMRFPSSMTECWFLCLSKHHHHHH